MARKTPAARALVGALALRDDSTTINQAFRLAGYELVRIGSDGESTKRAVIRNGRRVTVTRHAGVAASWLSRLGRKIEALQARRVA